jgi:hypothetical protein
LPERSKAPLSSKPSPKKPKHYDEHLPDLSAGTNRLPGSRVAR